jgi:MFS family permease
MFSRNLILLTLSQALGMSSVSGVTLIGGILGARLAPSPTLATLPISIMVLGTAISTIPASLLMRRIGRRGGFLTGASIAGLATLLAAYAVVRGSFFLFCLAVLLIGANSAFIQQYRFAATESLPPNYAGRAVSFILLGGILAGFLGPEIARRAKDWLPGAEFSGSFAALALLYALILALLLILKNTRIAEDSLRGEERPLLEILSQPTYRVAVLSGAVAYGVMSFIMTATPVYMHQMHGFDLSQTALVIQSHIIAMFLPSLFTGILIDRLGASRLMLAGLACFFICVLLGVLSRELLHFWGTLVILGIGWNLLFVGGTVLLTEAYHPQERFKAQATNDFTILGIQAIASLSAGTVLFRANWDLLMLLTLPVLALNLAAVLFLLRRKTEVVSVSP